MIGKLFGFWSKDVGIDLGTANTLVYIHDKGITINEPSIVALNQKTGKILAIGTQARAMVGRTPGHITVSRPLVNGVVSDYEVTEQMLKYFIDKVHQEGFSFLPRPRVVIGVPSGVTEVEKRAVEDATYSAGARDVYLIEEPMAAAIGAGLPITEPSGNMIVDIGGGTTEVAVISLAGIVYSRSVRVAGDKMDEAIIQYLKRKYNLLIGERTAENIKISVGNAYPSETVETVEVKGRDLIAGVPKTIEVNSDEIRDALQEPINAIVDAVRVALERTPPELAADIVDKGIVMAGGGSLLKRLDVLLREETGLPVMVAEEALNAIVLGSGKALEQLSTLRGVMLD